MIMALRVVRKYTLEVFDFCRIPVFTVKLADSQTNVHPVADPGFPVGGERWGAPTSDAGAFWQKHMRKQKNWVSLGVVCLGSANGIQMEFW